MKFLSKLNNTKTIIALCVIALTVSLATLNVWWKQSYSSAENVFNRMLASSLSTTSVTKSSSVGNELQSISQETIAKIEAPQVLHTRSVINQGQGEQQSSVSRETLVTLENTYIKLTDIQTNQTTQAGEDFDFSTVLDMWGSSPATENDNSLAQLYSQNVAVPYASLSRADRTEVLKLIQDQSVYEVDFAAAQKSSLNGREVYTYAVGVKPAGFISMMKLIGQKVGIAGYDDVNPEDYEALPVVPFTFVVDVISGNLVSVDYGDGQVENFSAHGLKYTPEIPQNPISMEELQTRLQSLQ